MAGALSMAAGEFAAERALADAEAAELQRKGAELAADENDELAERTALHNFRGMDPWLACEVSTELRWHEAFRAPDRGEFGLHPTRIARCYEAAAVSAASFAAGAFLPVAAVAAGPAAPLPALVIPTALFALGALGAWAAQLGGAPPMREALRVVVWGAAAMLVTGLAGLLVPMRTA
jgi:VIT1/CCC1 family predicted Fe2+/Mn2+ transporter